MLCIIIFSTVAVLFVSWKELSYTETTIKKIGKSWWYIQDGHINLKYTGLAKNQNGIWFVKNGKVDFGFNGIQKYKSAQWYIQNGKCNILYTGLTKYNNVWWYIRNGKVDNSYTGLIGNENGQWYVQNGKVNFEYNNFYYQNGILYDIRGGRVEHETRMVAHRGLSSQAPDNTVKAFELAGQAGFWGCETDIYLTKDNQFIITHDDDFKKTCGVNKKPSEMTVEEIKELKIKNGSNYNEYCNDDSATRIPTLEEYLQVCKQYNMIPFIEIKENAYSDSESNKQTAELLYKKVKEIMENQQVVFISTDLYKLQQMRAVLDENQDKMMEVQHVVYTASTDMIDTYKSFTMNLDSSFTGISMEDIQQFRANGITVGVWIVDEEQKVYDFARAGVDYITTGTCFDLREQ